MAESNQLNLTVIALVALVAIIALVALVLNVAAPVSTGVGQVSAADDANLLGQNAYAGGSWHSNYYTGADGNGGGGGGGGGSSGSSYYCTCTGPVDPDAGAVCSGRMLRTACEGQQGCRCTN